jgi:leucyl aminopeptidase
MPSYEVSRARVVSAEVEMIAIPAIAAPALEDEHEETPTTPPEAILGVGAQMVEEALGIDLAAELRSLRFSGDVGTTARIPTRGAMHAEAVLVVGLGKEEDLDVEAVRKAGAAIGQATQKVSSLATTVHAGLPGLDQEATTQALAEGIDLAAYRFTAHKSKPEGHDLDGVLLHAGEDGKTGGMTGGARNAAVYVRAARLGRDLVNEPPMNKRPPAFADRAKAEVRGTGVKVKVLDEKALEDGGYGGMIAVGKGSDAPPRLVELTYAPKGAKRHVALVGKGITFDTGGLSLKPSTGMMTMKLDMGGAAAVLATVRAAAELELPVKVTGILALAENMPSGSAQRPSDVYTARNGKTVEVLNTDAEGRLVLSDGLSHACELEPDIVVDLATLTGAVQVALGDDIGGLMATDDDLADALLAASERSGERLWRLPPPDDYSEHLQSEVADLKNIGKPGKAGTLIGGLFLKEFVTDGTPWAHLDIAGIAWSDEEKHYIRKGGTGAPVRTLLHWLSNRP